MTKEELQERINKKEKQIAKIEKRIAKWENKRNEASFWKEEEWLWDSEWETKEQFFDKHYPNYLKECDYQIRMANLDLEDAKKVIDKYKTSIEKIINFEKEEKIEVLVTFLNDWKNKAHEWYINNYEEYDTLMDNEKEAYNKYLNENIDEWNNCKSYNSRWHFKERFYKTYYETIASLTKSLAEWGSKEFEIRLTKLLDEEATRKYKDLVHRITDVVGEITNANNLSIGEQNGEINGIVEGTKGKAKIETISAGGYNIQCFHYRVLVNKVA